MNTRTLTGTRELSGTTEMPVATQTPKLPDVRVTPDDLRAGGPIRVAHIAAVPGRPEVDADATVRCVGRFGGHVATLLIDGDCVMVRPVGTINACHLSALAGVAEEVSRRVFGILREKRETTHAS